MKARLPLCALGLAALLCPCAQAQMPFMPQYERGMMSLGLNLGATAPASYLGRLVGPGPALGLRYEYFLWDTVSIGAEAGSFNFAKKTIRAAEPAFTYDLKTQASAAALLLVARLNLLQERSWSPYLLGGVGYHRLGMTVSVSNSTPPGVLVCTGSVCTASVSGSESGMVVSGGAGFEAFLIQNISLSAEARYYDFQTRELKLGNTLLLDDGARTLAFLIGVRYWFGMRR